MMNSVAMNRVSGALSLAPETRSKLLEKGLSLLVGILILSVAHLIGSRVKREIYLRGVDDIKDRRAKAADETNLSSSEKSKQLRKTKLLFVILGQVAYYGIVTIAVLIILKLLGIEATSIIALLGATGFTLGLALQGTFSDVTSGVLLALHQTYSIGEIVEIDGHKGRVMDFNMTHTILEDMDTRSMVIIPNRKISDSTIVNHTRPDVKRLLFEINISNKYEDWETLAKALKDLVSKYPGVLGEEPRVGVSDMSDVGTRMSVRFSVSSADMSAIHIPLRTHIRQFLVTQKVPLVDPF